MVGVFLFGFFLCLFLRNDLNLGGGIYFKIPTRKFGQRTQISAKMNTLHFKEYMIIKELKHTSSLSLLCKFS